MVWHVRLLFWLWGLKVYAGLGWLVETTTKTAQASIDLKTPRTNATNEQPKQTKTTEKPKLVGEAYG